MVEAARRVPLFARPDCEIGNCRYAAGPDSAECPIDQCAIREEAKQRMFERHDDAEPADNDPSTWRKEPAFPQSGFPEPKIPPELFPVSWEDIERETKALLPWIRSINPPVTRLIAIARGGLMPAAVIAHALDIRSIDTVCIGSYQGRERKEVKVNKFPSAISYQKGIVALVVDDIVDSGATMKKVTSLLPAGTKRVAVYGKEPGLSTCDYVGKIIPSDRWVVFPWEDQGPSYG